MLLYGRASGTYGNRTEDRTIKTLGKPTLKCNRCGYQWRPRGDIPPDRIKSCPDCKYRKWNVVKTEKPRANPDRDLVAEFEEIANRLLTEKPEQESHSERVARLGSTDAWLTEKPIPEPERTGSREYDQFRKAKAKQAMTRYSEMTDALEPCPDCGSIHHKTCKQPLTEKPRPKLVPPKTEKPIPKPETHSCHDCGEPGEYSIDATDLNFTDQGTEFITYQEWFCAEHYQERTKNLP